MAAMTTGLARPLQPLARMHQATDSVGKQHIDHPVAQHFYHLSAAEFPVLNYLPCLKGRFLIVCSSRLFFAIVGRVHDITCLASADRACTCTLRRIAEGHSTN